MIEIDSGVDDGYVDVHTFVIDAVDVEAGVPWSGDPRDARRHALRRHGELTIRLDVFHEWAMGDACSSRCRHAYRESTQGVLVDVPSRSAMGAGEARSTPPNVRDSRLQHDDVRLGRFGPSGAGQRPYQGDEQRNPDE